MAKKIHKLILMIGALPKTLWFNFRYLSFKEAIRLPIIISHRVAFQRMDGNIAISKPVRFGMIRIGFHENPAFDQSRIRAVWNNAGTVVFKGTAYLGNGSCIANFGKLVLGDNFQMSGNSTIICKEDISFGKDALIGWNCSFMDGDAHKIHVINSSGGEVTNPNRPIIIDEHVWIGMGCMILKGTNIPKGCVIAANTCIHSGFTEENSIIGGYPAKIIKRDIWWEG